MKNTRTHRFNTSKHQKEINTTLIFSKIFAENVKTELKTTVKGVVKSYISDDMLIVHIYGVNGIVFNFIREDIATAIVNGLSSKTIATFIHKRYSDYIKSLFFQ